jgi:hypothetical protein
MRFSIPLLFLLVTAFHAAHPMQALGTDLSATERTQLERKAASGNAAAAWDLSMFYRFHSVYMEASDRWMLRAVELDHAQAQRSLADMIKDRNYSPKGFGVTAPDAVKHLLERSSRTEGNACYELASAYSEGYFGSKDQAQARSYFERGAGFADRTCWVKLSDYYRRGLGGPRNDSEAYYWISLEARCVDPRSWSGKETWTAREEIAGHLALAELEAAWKRIDAFMAQVAAKIVKLDTPPFLSGMIDPKIEAEGRRLSQQREDEHRNRWRIKKA